MMQFLNLARKRFIVDLMSKTFLKFFVSGFSAFIIDTIILNILIFSLNDGVETAPLFGIVTTEKLVSGSLGIIISFILNKYWTFSNQKSKLISQGYKMFISYVFSILLGAVLITLYINILTWQNVIYIGNVIPTMSNFLTVGTIMIMNFFIYKYIVFK